jgi:hypothetical protein
VKTKLTEFITNYEMYENEINEYKRGIQLMKLLGEDIFG